LLGVKDMVSSDPPMKRKGDGHGIP
jgi:hypothetical protein